MVKNLNPAPTVGQTRCAGLSLVISHALYAAVIGLFSIDYNAYDVDSPQDVIELHNKISSKEHRTEVETGVVFLWIAFPLFICGIYGWSKYFKYIFFNTPMEILVYLLEKAYLIWVLILCIILPSLSLVAVSFDWTHGVTSENVTIDNIPAGYYNQLYVSIYQLELIDAISIAEACVLLSLFILGRYMSYKALKGDRKWKLFFESINICKNKPNCLIRLFSIMSIIFVIAFFIIFALILFEFGEYGIFAPDSRLKFLIGFVIFIKIMFGFELSFIYSRPDVLSKIKKLFADVDNTGAALIAKDNDGDIELQQTHGIR